MRSPKFPKSNSTVQIENYSDLLRIWLGYDDSSYFNIISAVENDLAGKLRDFSLAVWPKSRLGDVEAFTEFAPLRMIVREDVYEGAYRDDVRSRFTIAHELGHLCLHWGYPRPRLAPSAQKYKESRADARVEMEAHQFAGAFLMPESVARNFDDPGLLARRCRVSELAATRRLHELSVHGHGLIDLRKLFGKKP